MKTQMFMFANTSLKFDLPQARVIVDREKVADLGMDLASVAQELGVLLGGGYVNRFNYFNRSYQVIPQLAAEDRKSFSSLMNLKIRAPGGELIPVSSFASIEPHTAPRSLKRFQQQSAIQIFGEPLPIPMLTKEMCLSKMEEIIREVAGDQVSIDYGGESRQLRNESSSLTVTLGFALVLIYLVLSAQFHSFRDPLIVLLGSVPLAISGALALTFVGLTTINIYSQVGLITLVGLVAKNGILIVEFANHLQEHGHAKLEAIMEASKTRLRPVLITSAATVFRALSTSDCRRTRGHGQKQYRYCAGCRNVDRNVFHVVRRSSSLPHVSCIPQGTDGDRDALEIGNLTTNGDTKQGILDLRKHLPCSYNGMMSPALKALAKFQISQASREPK